MAGKSGNGALLALWLQKNKDMKVEKALQKYTEYIYRELYDENTGIVYNDAGRDNTWNRLYNYPWLAIFLWKDTDCIMRLLILKICIKL